MKMRSLQVAAVFTLALCACTGSRNATGETDSTVAVDSSASFPTADLTDEIDRKVDSVMSVMTLHEKAAQLVMPTMFSHSDTLSLIRLREYTEDLKVGGIVLLRGDLASVAKMASVANNARIPLFIAVDAEWGLGMRLEDAPVFPRNGKLTDNADEQLLYDYGREIARECRRTGINMILGPVVDVASNPNGMIGSRSFGGDPRRVADLGVAYASGLESGGVISVAKHFPGHGSPAGDSHRLLPKVDRDFESLDSIDLYPFRRYADAGLKGIMVGHLAVPSVDSLYRPAAVSPQVIDGLLRNGLGFRGLVLTDALNMKGAAGYCAADAIAAGADIAVGPADTRGEIDIIVRRVEDGSLDAATVDDRVKRVIFHKFLLNLYERNEFPADGLQEDVKGNSDSLRIRLSE